MFFSPGVDIEGIFPEGTVVRLLFVLFTLSAYIWINLGCTALNIEKPIIIDTNKARLCVPVFLNVSNIYN
jgi:hypothetical protein